MNAAAREIDIPTQNTTLTRPAFIAPGISAITMLSTISIVRMDNVSAARTTLSAVPSARPAFNSGNVDSE